jgi:hypothetical protein
MGGKHTRFTNCFHEQTLNHSHPTTHTRMYTHELTRSYIGKTTDVVVEENASSLSFSPFFFPVLSDVNRCPFLLAGGGERVTASFIGNFQGFKSI